MQKSFEQVCADSEIAAAELEGLAKRLQRAAKAMKKAAEEGNPAKVHQSMSQLQLLAAETNQAFRSMEVAWSVSDEEIMAYLEKDFSNDLIESSEKLQVKLSRLDDRLAAFPVIVQVLAGQKSIKVNARRHGSLRPSVIAAKIKVELEKKPGGRPEQFIEILNRAYQLVVGTETNKGAVLIELYDALTLLPDARRSYEKTDFYRDVYRLDASGVRKTRAGANVTFPAATGARSGRSFTVVGPDQLPKCYYAVRFEELNP